MASISKADLQHSDRSFHVRGNRNVDEDTTATLVCVKIQFTNKEMLFSVTSPGVFHLWTEEWRASYSQRLRLSLTSHRSVSTCKQCSTTKRAALCNWAIACRFMSSSMSVTNNGAVSEIKLQSTNENRRPCQEEGSSGQKGCRFADITWRFRWVWRAALITHPRWQHPSVWCPPNPSSAVVGG